MRARSLQHMSTARLARIRWRRSGAWLWPAFITLTLVDAVVGHLLPPVGETQSLVAAGSLISPGTIIPPRSLVMGRPGRVKRPLTDEEVAGLARYWQNYVEYSKLYLTERE